MIHVVCICAVKTHLRYTLLLPSPQTVEYNCMFTCHQQFLEGNLLMPFYENLHLITLIMLVGSLVSENLVLVSCMLFA